MRRWLLCVSVLLLVFARAPQGAVFIVWGDAPDDITRDCSEISDETFYATSPAYSDYPEKRAKKTIAAGLTCMSAAGPSHRLWINDGTYTVGIVGVPAGVLGARTQIRPPYSHRVILRPPDGTPCIDLTNGVDYIWIENIECDMSLQTGSTPGIALSGNTDVYIRGVRFSGGLDSFSPCIVIGETSTGVAVDYFNDITECGGHGVEVRGAGNQVSRNWIHSTGGYGVYATAYPSSDNNVISYNEIYENELSGIAVGNSTTGNNNIVVNNLVDNNDNYGIEVEGDGNLIVYNTVAGHDYGIFVDAVATNTVLRNNIAFTGTIGAGGNTIAGIQNNGTGTTQTTNTAVDPLFINPGARDFYLQASSVARNAATVDGTYTWDMRFVRRTVGGAPDTGAIEMPSGCPAGVCTLTSGQDLQVALDQAICGDVIKLTDAGIWDEGPYNLPSKNSPSVPCVTYTKITRTGTLPTNYDVIGECYQLGPTRAAEWARRDACRAALKLHYETNAPSIQSVGNPSVLGGYGYSLVSQFDADYWEIDGIEFESTATTEIMSAHILLGFDGSGAFGGDTRYIPMRKEQVPHHFKLNRLSIHSSDVPTAFTGKGILANADYVEFTNSVCYGIKSDNDAQCFMSWFGGVTGGQHLIENTYTEASGENILWGGAGPIFWMQTMSNLVVRYNYITKDPRWWPEAARIGYVYDGGPSPSVKNNLECKNCAFLEFYKNVIDTSYTSGSSQEAHLVLFQGANDGDGNLWANVSNITGWGNVLRHARSAFSYAGKSLGNGGAMMSANVHFHNNLAYGLSTMYDDALIDQTGSGHCLAMYSNSHLNGHLFDVNGIRYDDAHEPLTGIVFDHNTCDTLGENPGQMLRINSNEGSDQRMAGFVMTNNFFRSGGGYASAITMGVGACGNNTTCKLDRDAPTGWTVSHNVHGNENNQEGHPAGDWFERVVGDTTATQALWEDIFVNRDEFNYVVADDSPYKAGGARESIDGKDIGVDFSLLPDGAGEPEEPEIPEPRIRLRFPRIAAILDALIEAVL